METANNNFTERELSVATWLVYHKNGVRRMSVGLLIGIAALTWGYFLFTVLNSYLIHRGARLATARLLTASTVPLSAFHESAAPQDLMVSAADEVGSGSSSGALTTIQNPNTNWLARVTYITASTKQQETTSVAPGDTIYLFSKSGEAATIDTAAVYWQRLSRATVSNIEEYKKTHRNFVIKDPKYSADVSQDKKSTIYHVSFSITNATPYSYWEVPTLVLLNQGNRVGGALTTVIDNFKTGETRLADAVLTQPIGGVSSIEVIPQVDIFDPASYMPLPQAPRIDIGT